MAKKIKAFIKLALKAGKATAQPPVGPALSPYGVNSLAFCKEYNERTADKIGMIVPVKITVYDDKSYSFILKSPPTSALLMQYANIKKGSAQPNKGNAGSVTLNQIKEVALIKLSELNTKNVQKAILIVIGTAKSIGIAIQPEQA
jgi:large subunit ribosomal protein L11|uniref:Large ribosomal subunit protein uL11m n=1 Tax=Spumella sp. Baekdong012001B8 TaxID=2782410 RepID=A0A7S6TA53_9STRA|nr:ribosomal protein L11 [Spumella sp. Baekdong012001B8]